jgi:hypothetical protein
MAEGLLQADSQLAEDSSLLEYPAESANSCPTDGRSEMMQQREKPLPPFAILQPDEARASSDGILDSQVGQSYLLRGFGGRMQMINYRDSSPSRIRPMAIRAGEHTMGESLLPYLALKVHPLVCADRCVRILVVPKYDRSTGISPREKPGKLFNYIRPTAVELSESEVELRCFPGKDYLFHFGSIVASFAHNQGRSVNVECIVPGAPECWSAIQNTGIADVPVCRTAILGYVECLDQLSPDSKSA